jgi:AcrR family transcriptional regulator
MTIDDGWSAVTMARLADAVGVSRQTVYNEVGSKPGLAQALVLDELARFLAVVEVGFGDHPGDVDAAVRAAVVGVLELAQDNPLLQAVVAGTHGADTDLLPLLTTSSLPLLDVAGEVVSRRLAAYCDDAERVAIATDVLVRVTLSHVMAPSRTPARTSSALADAVARLLR